MNASITAPQPRQESDGGTLVLRVHDANGETQVVQMTTNKCTIGRSPSCTLALEHDGIRPVHCLIVRGRRQTFVRRWAPESLLNDLPFVDAPITHGDRLRVGETEIEVLACGSGQARKKRSELSTADEVNDGSDSIPTAGEKHDNGGSSDEPRPATVANIDTDEHGRENEAAAQRAAEFNRHLRQRARQLLASLRDERKRSAKTANENVALRSDYNTVLTRLASIEADLSVERGQWTVKQAQLEGEVSEVQELKERLGNELTDTQHQLKTAKQAAVDLEDAARECRESEFAARANAQLLEEQLEKSEGAMTELRQQFEKDREAWTASEVERQHQPKESESAADYDIEASDQQLLDLEGCDPLKTGEIQPDDVASVWTPDDGAEIDEFSVAEDGLVQQDIESGSVDPDEETAPDAVELDVEREQAESRLNEIVHHMRSVQDKDSQSKQSDEPQGDEFDLTDADGATRSLCKIDLTHAGEAESAVDSEPQPIPSERENDPNGFPSAGHGEETEAAFARLRELNILNDDSSNGTDDIGATVEAVSHSTPEDEGVAGSIDIGFPSHENRLDCRRSSSDPCTDEQKEGRHLLFSPLLESSLSDSIQEENEPELHEPDRDRENTGDEALEEYMSRLMDRVRGQDAPPASQAVEPTEPSTQAPQSIVAEETPEAVTPLQQNRIELNDIKRSTVAPERNRDFEALRHLANTTARQAINTHASKIQRHRTFSKFLVSVVGILSGILMVVLSPTWKSLPALCGVGSMVAGLFWGGQTLVLLRNAIRRGSLEEAEAAWMQPGTDVPEEASGNSTANEPQSIVGSDPAGL